MLRSLTLPVPLHSHPTYLHRSADFAHHSPRLFARPFCAFHEDVTPFILTLAVIIQPLSNRRQVFDQRVGQSIFAVDAADASAPAAFVKFVGDGRWDEQAMHLADVANFGMSRVRA